MVRMKRAAFAGLAAGLLIGLSGCISPLLLRIQEEIARAPFIGTAYTFLRQWGNLTPEFSFLDEPKVKTDSAGYVYVADRSFRVRKFNASGQIQKVVGLVSKQGVQAQLYDMAFDAAGNMYVVTGEENQIQKYDVNGNILTSWGGTTLYGVAELSYPRGIAVDSSGNVYVTDSGSNQRIVKFTSSGTYVTDWGGATTYPDPISGGPLALSSPVGVAVDSGGYVYVTDSGNNRILVFDSLGNYQDGWGGTEVYGTGAISLYYPEGITIRGSSVYVLDRQNARVVKFSTSGTYESDWGSYGSGSGQFNYPDSIAVDTSGSIYVADAADIWGRVQKFSSPPAVAATWGLDATQADGKVNLPWGVAFDSAGNIYVADVFGSRVQEFDPSGTFIKAWGEQGTGPGQFSAPMGIAIDASDNVYVLENGGDRIQKFDSSGTFLNTWGQSGSGQVQFSQPFAIALDSLGNIYVADFGNHRVQMIDKNGYWVKDIGLGQGSGDGQFEEIYGVAVDSKGYVYVSDMALNRIQKFDTNGTFVAQLGSVGSGDGELNNPIGLAVDAIDNVYVCDMANRRIQKFDSSGNFLTTWGSVGDTNVGNGAFSWVVALAVNSAGHVVATDYSGNLIQEFEPTF